MSSQLLLRVRPGDQARFVNYFGDHNAAALARFRTMLAEGAGPLWLCGDQGVGKSHLLQAACTEMQEEQAGTGLALYASMEELAGLGPGSLEGLETARRLCLDDLDRVLGDPEWDLAVFHLFNRLQDRQAQMVFSAVEPPGLQRTGLADLASRLGSCLVVQLARPTDADRQLILQQRAALRGLVVSDELAAYLLRRVPRDTERLLELLDRLDEGSLRRQRRLTVPFVRELMGW